MKEKPTILLVHNFYQVPGGEDTVVANEEKLLKDQGHRVVRYTRHNAELKTMSKLRKLLLPVTTVFNPRTYREVKRIIRQENVDIVHVHNTLNLVSPSVYYAAFACGVPVVQTVHNFRLLCPGANFFRDGDICEDCLTKGLCCALRHNCYRGSRLQTLACVLNTKLHRMLGTYQRLNYICLTSFNRKKLLQLNRPGKKPVFNMNKIYIKPNFTPETPFTAGTASDYFCYAGRLEDIKGTKLLFRAWESMGTSAPKLIVCGTGPQEEWCRQFLSEHPQCPIEMQGFVPNQEVKKLIAGARALVLPSQCYEGFPVTIVEAYSVGTPVITGNLGNAASLVEPYRTGMLFDYASPEALAAAVSQFCQEKTEEWHSRIEEKYWQEFSPEHNYEMLSGVYQKILTRTSG